MKTKQFFLYSIVYIAIVAILVFTQQSSSYTLGLFGFTLTLPVAVWIVLPLILYMILAIFHIVFHSFAFYRTKRAIAKDLSAYDAMSKEVLLGLDTNKDFKTEYFKDPSELTKILSPWYDSTGIDVKNEDLKEVIGVIEKVKNGEVADLRKYKLPKDNGLFLQNELNRLDAEPAYAYEILKTKGVYSENITKKAYAVALAKGSYNKIKAYKIPQDIAEVNILVDRAVNDASFEISSEELFDLVNNEKFSEQDFIGFAKKLKNHLAPEQYKAFFERLKNENQEATEAYLYALYELGMIDEFREQLSLADGDEFEKFKILLFLRDNGKNVPASLLF
nr:LapA family protein [uncultured Campylobacter sp.]